MKKIMLLAETERELDRKIAIFMRTHGIVGGYTIKKSYDKMFGTYFAELQWEIGNHET